MRRLVPVLVVVLALPVASCSSDGAGHVLSPSPLPPAPAASPSPSFRGDVAAIDAAILDAMGTSWRKGCPVPLHELRAVRISTWGFDGAVHQGTVLVSQSQASNVLGAFRAIFDARFPIENVAIADGYIGNDPRRAPRNPTTGFNCRPPVGRTTTTTWSEHAYGLAIDVNPVQNPRVSDAGVVPPEGAAYVNRSMDVRGMIHSGDAVVRAFESIGWVWGGTYQRVKDYQHFSLNGR